MLVPAFLEIPLFGLLPIGPIGVAMSVIGVVVAIMTTMIAMLRADLDHDLCIGGCSH